MTDAREQDHLSAGDGVEGSGQVAPDASIESLRGILFGQYRQRIAELEAELNELERRIADEDALITRQEPRNGIGFQGGLGASYNFSEQLAVYFEGYYHYRNTVVETTLFSGATSQFDSNLSHLGVTIGIRYYY